jgi:hypothetical protein
VCLVNASEVMRGVGEEFQAMLIGDIRLGRRSQSDTHSHMPTMKHRVHALGRSMMHNLLGQPLKHRKEPPVIANALESPKSPNDQPQHRVEANTGTLFVVLVKTGTAWQVAHNRFTAAFLVSEFQRAFGPSLPTESFTDVL